LASWFDPALKDKRLYPMSRRGAEFLRAVSSSPLPMGEKLTCYSIVMDGWFKRYWRQIGSECRLAMKSFFLKKA
jgi:hypothetical protein